MFGTRAMYVIVARDFKRFFRQKGRLVTTLARPLLWLFLVGLGLTKIVNTNDGTSYLQFILPGVIGMTILFSSIFSTISVVWDREFGFLREMLVAPVSRFTIVAGKLMAGTGLSLFQGMALLVIAPFIGITVGLKAAVAMFFLIALVALAITALGLFIAARLNSLEGFNVIMNFIVLPMFFLSGALYPLSTLPAALKYLTFINPLTYGVDAFKHVLLTSGGGAALTAELPLYVDIAALAGYAAVMIVLSAWSFERR
ncbi:MAG: ABC transporter permease [Deltaproteobacteria bacterium]|nr:ABC transporter permease [Deltaproteobacteria bacterium]